MAIPFDTTVTARHLRDLGRQPALAPCSETLTALANALDSSDADALDAWADLDVMAHFARPESVAPPPVDDRGERLDGILDWVLGALVFLPLLFTWLGLWRASSAYGALVGADPKAAGRPFLQLWQSGFQGHLSETFRFGHVAVGGCVALAMLFVLTAVHGYRRTAAERRDEQARQREHEVLARLAPILTRTQLALNVHRFASPARFAGELNAAAGRLQRMHTKAITTQEQLTRAAELVGEATERADQRMAQAEASVKPLEQVLTEIESTVKESGTAIRTAVQDLDTPLTEAGRLLVGAVGDQREVLTRAFEELRAAGDVTREVLARTADRLEDAVTGNGDGVRDALTDATRRVEDSLAALTAAQRGFTTGIEVVADLNGRLIDDLGTVAVSTGEAAAASREAVAGLEGRSTALLDSAGRFAVVADILEAAVREAQSARARAEAAQAEAESARSGAVAARAEAEEIRREAEEVLRRAAEGSGATFGPAR
ncbi:hypothetical protein [Streptomyces lichenis]|uniref:Methyl-accepting chemotaxis protein n=1 Tax=Streptomyces lichenis TaxID=2306967 RepID=A0ABT0I3X2_9ACTN|nr:hypothetical protein [Streptomyces lichenis]MCK8676022.1 hypothetical protein [Streptomyces lichenis]